MLGILYPYPVAASAFTTKRAIFIHTWETDFRQYLVGQSYLSGLTEPDFLIF
jgi:hypothetical protein